MALNDEKGPSPGVASSILYDLFAEGNTITGAAIHNVPGRLDITFDFKGLTFFDASIENYENFHRCEFDDRTLFKQSRILTGMSEEMETTATAANFSECVIDDNLAQSLGHAERRRQPRWDDAVLLLRQVLQRFLVQGQYGGPRSTDSMQRGFHGSAGLRFADLIRICVDAGLMSRRAGRHDVEIVPSLVRPAGEFVEQSVYRGAITSAIDAILKEID